MRALENREIVLISLIVVLVVAVIVLATYLGIYSHDRINYKNGVDNVYRHAYFALMENYVDIETDLAKCSVTSGSHMLEEILGNVSDNAGLAALSLSTLNTENNNLTNIFRFTNQVGDYSKYLVGKIEKGEHLTDNERETLEKMQSLAHKVGEALSSVKDNVTQDSYSFVDSLGKDGDAVSIVIRDLNNGTIEYPALIYDGPFSDGIHNIKPKNLSGEEITHEQGMDRIRKMFEDVHDIKFVSESTNKFTSYIYDAVLGNGSQASIQISKIGGHIVMFTTFYESDKHVVSEDEAKEIGRTQLEKHGYENMYPVYISNSKGVYYINYAPKVDDIIYYPDLIKLKVTEDTGKVVGMESLNYIYNHTVRSIDKDSIKLESEVIEGVSSSLDIDSVRLALIPRDVGRELLTYEVIGTHGESRYYIYLDAVTGEEVNVLFEIKSGGGNLLI